MSILAKLTIAGSLVTGAILAAVASNHSVDSESAPAQVKAQVIEAQQGESSGDLIVKFNQSLPLITSRYPVQKAKATNVSGLYELVLENGQVIYASADGKNVIFGSDFSLYEIQDQTFVNLTENTREQLRLAKLDAIERTNQIVFTPKGEVKASVLVFTDVDCGYCRKLHSEMAQYHAEGIEIRYAAYPRAGIGSDSYKKIVSAWCADNQQETMTLLKSRQQVDVVDCDHPVDEHFRLGQQLGVNGTPSMFTADGKMIPGQTQSV
jgi:thiol:disulfide interchange protein DsbC